ncbi:hypothetical protein BGZ61DRAFT_561935 [Ilyonectria robusta]|uniref:uncharacterized protein n=1 Tax=Ilyonectria robusta TaxID=1079257 RepID=UPI001E8DF305|nr:uncharacterized protein BGZ61DRAFT_561935 [Ilyonectria robusta]KAH8664955.1 hypothetical protein BGZ61DRAFT_561935 [Ilyonectria robusta]
MSLLRCAEASQCYTLLPSWCTKGDLCEVFIFHRKSLPSASLPSILHVHLSSPSTIAGGRGNTRLMRVYQIPYYLIDASIWYWNYLTILRDREAERYGLEAPGALERSRIHKAIKKAALAWKKMLDIIDNPIVDLIPGASILVKHYRDEVSCKRARRTFGPQLKTVIIPKSSKAGSVIEQKIVEDFRRREHNVIDALLFSLETLASVNNDHEVLHQNNSSGAAGDRAINTERQEDSAHITETSEDTGIPTHTYPKLGNDRLASPNGVPEASLEGRRAVLSARNSTSSPVSTQLPAVAISPCRKEEEEAIAIESGLGPMESSSAPPRSDRRRAKRDLAKQKRRRIVLITRPSDHGHEYG